MNKTVNINLAGIFFHIDEDAYLKMQRYLDAIKRSFTDSQGRDEIIADIEARIAELFNEKIKDEKQVIGVKEVEEVITVMGQPEDYRLDEEIFEDEPSTANQTPKTSKQLFRDTTNSYVGGVSSGLSHYLGIDPIWIRLAWILFTIFSSGAFVLIYVAFWIFVPEAKTTSDFLAMKGEAVNISNIEKKIKEGFDGVADTVKNVDYQKYSNKVKSSSTTFFDALGDVLLFLLKIFVKFIGILLIIVSGITLISLFIGLFTVGTFGFMDMPWVEYFEVGSHPEVPLWLLSLLSFFAVGIPFFFLFILGLKILINNLKSIGTAAKLGLLGVWIFAIIGLIIIGIRQATLEAYDAEVITEEKLLPITQSDTLTIKMQKNSRYTRHLQHRHDYKIKRDNQGNRVIVTQDIEIYLKPSNRNNNVGISIEKKAEGRSYEEASTRAEDIKYSYEVDDKTLLLDGYAITEYANKYRDQEVKVILTLPDGVTIFADDNTSSYNNSWKYDDYITIDNKEEKYLQIINGELVCENCPDDENEWKYKESDDDSVNININTDDSDTKLKINEEGVRLKSEEVDIKIDENGIDIKTDN
ncbi:PspC domain-containing protein [Aquimarina sp. AD10]|uniref:PspC domain-containing protein n=1 Tax=Aquimarina sp. AD10 TaxID=1714849 RepID=UPI000E4E6C0D|nr:PspC domain-containing protein [Aquimarina sp. AD10]AXT60340.1 PspC domain-containing protein [Aquimarina sp. AD10]RKN01226.1 PspC domain-containing protein [Aquimarina sp. AD10]